MVVRQCAIPRLDAELSQSVAALVGQEVLIAVPIDVARADQRLECSGASFSPAACRFSSRMIWFMRPP
jgi:hypothetical protein